MTRIILLSDGYDMSPFEAPLLAAASNVTIVDSDSPVADVAVCWRPPTGSLRRLRGLKLIHSIAAGVDHILSDPDLPAVPICRVVDPAHAQGMTEFVTWGVLHFHRQIDTVLANQRRQVWSRPLQVAAVDRTIGVMGLGTLGACVAEELQRMGFSVKGWSRLKKNIPGIACFDSSELDGFLSGVDILVCLLPLTEVTHGILNEETIALLPRGAKLIHVGRGEHLVSADFLRALRDGQLGAAIVDVFEKEPLLPGDAYWTTPNLVVTPHMASVASFEKISRQIADNIERLNHGKKLVNLIDRDQGY